MTAAAFADEQVAKVRGDPRARVDLLRRLYQVPVEVDRGYLPYRRAATALMRWQLRRGLLNPETHAEPGSPWWRMLNESLLLDTSEASALAFGLPGMPRTPRRSRDAGVHQRLLGPVVVPRPQHDDRDGVPRP